MRFLQIVFMSEHCATTNFLVLSSSERQQGTPINTASNMILPLNHLKVNPAKDKIIVHVYWTPPGSKHWELVKGNANNLLIRKGVKS
mmetsp:Transcript_25279/g.83546  ORF Transcript_25279/g.83546 Transcript_25279/m.83546 type:complete len:87 (-) Transcript_25279:95-355(-)